MKFWRKYHKWIGIILCFFLILFAISGIILNHRSVFSRWNISRSLLSDSYQYKNWNLAALKGSVQQDSALTIFYGNVGCWQYNSVTKQWIDFNQGFPKGIDHRRISKMAIDSTGQLYAGTLFGLYKRDRQQWEKITLPGKHERISDLLITPDTLQILTRSELYQMPLIQNAEIKQIHLPAPSNYDGRSSLFKTIWILHSGEAFGIAGKLFVDLLALVLLFLCITAGIWVFAPGLIRRAKKKMKSANKLKKSFRFSVKWHNKLGYYTVFFLIFTTFTGMFLRPPLLIAIAQSKVKNLPFTILDSPNAWYDQLRAIQYNAKYDVYILSTSKGMYALANHYKEMVKIPEQPPVSVMGINAFNELSPDSYLVGSFSGLFAWNPFQSHTLNYFTGKPVSPQVGMGRPIGRNMVSGYHFSQGGEYYFDYNAGATLIKGNSAFPEMPNKIIEQSPMSLWNLALEVHTGRIFQDLFGSFYILIIPLVGLLTLALLISGLWIYWKKY
jgi:hypothetical protein